MAGGLAWGAVGVACADVLSTFIMFVPFMWLSFRHSPVSFAAFWHTLARPIASSVFVGMTLVGYRFVLPPAGPLWTLAGGGALAAAVLATTWLALPGGREELNTLGDALNEVIRKPAQSSASQAVE